jgi:hypothetical protein
MEVILDHKNETPSTLTKAFHNNIQIMAYNLLQSLTQDLEWTTFE